jgi:hypothetical protein
MRQCDTRLNLDDAAMDVDPSEAHEILTWIYHFDEMRTLAACPFRGSMICAWNSMILPENITIGVLMVHTNVPREQSSEFLTTKAKEMCARFSADSVPQRVKSLQWAKRIYSHKREGYESLREAVIGGLRPSRNEVVQMVEGQMLIDSNEDFKRDLERDFSSDNINDGCSGNLDEDIAKGTTEKAAEVEGETPVDRDERV